MSFRIVLAALASALIAACGGTPAASSSPASGRPSGSATTPGSAPATAGAPADAQGIALSQADLGPGYTFSDQPNGGNGWVRLFSGTSSTAYQSVISTTTVFGSPAEAQAALATAASQMQSRGATKDDVADNLGGDLAAYSFTVSGNSTVSNLQLSWTEGRVFCQVSFAKSGNVVVDTSAAVAIAAKQDARAKAAG